VSLPSTPEPIPASHVRDLLAERAYQGVRTTILDNNPGMSEDTASRVLDEALKFLVACARFPHVYVQPSRVVDEGWHALILHTAPYRALCEQLGGFIDHFPERSDPTRHDQGTTARTVALIGEAGYTPDLELWRGPERELVSVAAECSHTPKPGGCGPIDPGKFCANKPH
jgi:hypothetical protein